MTAPQTPATQAAPAYSPPPIPRRSWFAFAVLILGIAMALIDTTIVNVALPVIRESLKADEATLSWIISGYALAYGLALIPAGRIGDRIGHKPVFIVGLVIFTGASLWAGLANDSASLIVARVVQGLGGGIFFPAVTAFIQLMFPGRARGRAFAIMGATIGFSTALGPIVGGLLIQWLGDADGWRSIFFVNLPFGVIAVIAALMLLPSGAEGKSATGADLVGLVLLAGGLVAILVPLIQGEQAGWPWETYVSMAGGLVLLVLFALWEIWVARRGKSPLVPPHLFSHASFTGGTILALVYFAAFTSIFFTISIFWQAGLGHTALESGLVSIPFAIGSIIGASQSNRLAERLGRTTLSIGTGMVAIGLIALWLVLLLIPASDLTNWELLVPLLVAGVGSGLFIAPNAQFIVATVDRAEAGAASGVIGTVQRIGSAIGIAVIGSVFFGNLPASFAPTDAQVAAAGQEFGSQGQDAVKAAIQKIVDQNLADGFGSSATIALLVSAIFAVAAFLLVFALPRRISRGYDTPPVGE
ncbi:MAG TPA: MFS transporter [Pseudolysinimonas sp.]|jgi:EmrB/QacA subfamily drug resistance transporter|nr:MFS transporter [Pseudolysinimonas sp.]